MPLLLSIMRETLPHTDRGYILVESIVAISIILTGLLGIFSLLSQSLGLNRVVGDRYVGTYLAAEGIEIVKNIIDTNVVNGRPYNAGLSSGAFEVEYGDTALTPSSRRKMKFDSDKRLYNYLTGKDTRLYREVRIQLIGSEEIKVHSVVSWSSRGGGSFEVDLEDHFYNWR